MRTSLLIAFGMFGAASGAVLPVIDFPRDSPVTILSSDPGDSGENARGGAWVLDLHTALLLRNSSTQKRIRGITLAVEAESFTPGGKGSVTVASLDIAPGDSFPVHIDMRLLRPVQTGNGVPVRITLDGVLFDDLAFYGPDRLNSRRTLTVCEWQARRDRKYFKDLLAAGGPERVQQEILADLARPVNRTSADVQMVRNGPATNVEPERQLQFAFLRMPDSPVEALRGSARLAGDEARAPRIEIRNRSTRPVRSLEIGWILHDQQGHEFLAGSVPAEMRLAPGQTQQVLKESTLKIPHRSAAMSVDGMTAFVSSVEFADGAPMWIPSRADLADPALQRVLGPSPEEQRLVQIYRKHGLQALVNELKKF